MKTLYLLRHAKSSWNDPGLADLDRPLNKRGRETAKTMAAYLRRAKITPDVVLCSTAVRAKQTLEPIAKAIKPRRVTFESRIYGVAQPELLKYLRGLPETVECAVMIGHNPGLHDLALTLADTKSRKRLPPAEGKFPTGAMAAFRFDGTWKELRSNAATVLSFTLLRERSAITRSAFRNSSIICEVIRPGSGEGLLERDWRTQAPLHTGRLCIL